MRAVRFSAYGPPDALAPVDLPMPVPQRDEVLVRVHATTVTTKVGNVVITVVD